MPYQNFELRHAIGKITLPYFDCTYKCTVTLRFINWNLLPTESYCWEGCHQDGNQLQQQQQQLPQFGQQLPHLINRTVNSNLSLDLCSFCLVDCRSWGLDQFCLEATVTIYRLLLLRSHIQWSAIVRACSVWLVAAIIVHLQAVYVGIFLQSMACQYQSSKW